MRCNTYRRGQRRRHRPSRIRRQQRQGYTSLCNGVRRGHVEPAQSVYRRSALPLKCSIRVSRNDKSSRPRLRSRFRRRNPRRRKRLLRRHHSLHCQSSKDRLPGRGHPHVHGHGRVEPQLKDRCIPDPWQGHPSSIRSPSSKCLSDKCIDIYVGKLEGLRKERWSVV